MKKLCDTKSHVQCYECQIVKNGIAFDKCLEDELVFLWKEGITTVGCCCGNHIDSERSSSYIQVTSGDITKMLKLEYQQIKDGIFTPKTEIQKNVVYKYGED